jgi:tetratricopeptide (TPR) repeat protein
MKFFLSIVLLFFTLTTFAQRDDSGSSNEMLAVRLMQEGEFAKAASLFEELYEKNPTLMIYNNYLRCLLELQDFRKAERVVRNQIKNNPGRIRFEVDIGYLQHQMGDGRQARRHLEKLIADVPSAPSAINDLASAFLFRNYEDYALQTYLKGRSAHPHQFHLQIADIYHRRRDYPSMMREYIELAVADPASIEQVQGLLQDAINDDPEFHKTDALRRILLQSSQQRPSQTIYSELLLWLSVQIRDFNMAFRQARALDMRMQQEGKLVLDIANLSLANNQFEVARQSFEYIIGLGELKPHFIDATVGLLNAKYLQAIAGYEIDFSLLREVEKEYEKNIQSMGVHMQTISLIRNLAHLKAFYLNNTAGATQLLKHVIDMPNISSRIKGECRVELADILLLQGDLWDAHLLYAQVDKTFRDDPLAHEARFKNAKLSFYMGEFKWAQAQLDVLKAATSRLIANDAMQLSLLIQDNLGADGDSPQLKMFARAQMHYFMNNFDKALVVLDSLEQVFPRHSITDNVMMSKASIFIRTGKYNFADTILADITSKFPEGLLASDALFQRARLNEIVLRNKEKAMELYQELMMDYPGSLHTITARNRFRFLRGDIKEDEMYFNTRLIP